MNTRTFSPLAVCPPSLRTRRRTLAESVMASARAARSAQPRLASVGAAAAGRGARPAGSAERSASAARGRRVSRVTPDPLDQLHVEGPLIGVRRGPAPFRRAAAAAATPTSLRRWRTITFRVLARSSSRLRGLARSPRSGVTGAELGRGAEQPGRHQGDHLVQVLQAVLHRSGGQQQQEPGGQRPDELPGRAVRRSAAGAPRRRPPSPTRRRSARPSAGRGGPRPARPAAPAAPAAAPGLRSVR